MVPGAGRFAPSPTGPLHLGSLLAATASYLDARHLGIDWNSQVEIDPRYLRPAEVHDLLGDASKARQKLGWRPKVGFSELVGMMVAHDLELARQEKALRQAGHSVAYPGGNRG